MKTFAVYNLGCRVNAAESNLFAQDLINQGLSKNQKNPDIIFINTCSVTAKANIESLGLIRRLRLKHPKSKIIVSGCADFQNIKDLTNISYISNLDKENKLNILKSLYDRSVGDKFSNTYRYLLKIQSGCTANCSYCTVPPKRPYLWSLPIQTAVDTVNQAVNNGYREIIITGVNLNQYQFGLSHLLEALLTKTSAPLISFGSIPLLCIDNKFLNLYSKQSSRLSHFLHIPIQSGSDKILKLMNRPYTQKDILDRIKKIKFKIKNVSLGTDIIVGFPNETDINFKQTYKLCHQIGFKKIHVFRFSARPGTPIKTLFKPSQSIPQNIINHRSLLLRQLNKTS